MRVVVVRFETNRRGRLKPPSQGRNRLDSNRLYEPWHVAMLLTVVRVFQKKDRKLSRSSCDPLKAWLAPAGAGP